VRPGWIHSCLLLLTLVGCGASDRPTLVPATGAVTMDGKPLTAGAIVFHPEAGNPYMEDKPSSLLQLDGRFTMKTFPFGEGVSPGPYKVTLAPELATRIGKPEYSNPDKTPWSIDVPETGLSDQQFVVNGSTEETR
jgi:hypothetical protein